jgi:hypothetical protein
MKRNIHVRSPCQCEIVLEMRDCEIGKQTQMVQFATTPNRDVSLGLTPEFYDRCGHIPPAIPHYLSTIIVAARGSFKQPHD